MTDIERLKLNIETLKESIILNRMNLAERTREELQGIVQHTAWCREELEKLQTELNQALNSK
jgi:hypothetical protein